MADVSILSRELIAQHADAAAREVAAGAPLPTNPYPIGSDAAAAWKAALERFLLLHSTGEVSA